MKSAPTPTYVFRKTWVNFIDLQQRGLSYCAIGVYTCLTTNKQKEFTLEELAGRNSVSRLSDVEFAIEELLEAGLIELLPAAVVQGGVA